MKLSHEEEAFYDSTFQNFKQSGLSCDQENCLRILNRGIKDTFVCNKIWDLVSGHGSKKTLERDEVFVLLKYVAATQQGYQVDDIDIEELPELPIPHLPKNKGKKKKKKGTIENSNLVTEKEEVPCESDEKSPLDISNPAERGSELKNLDSDSKVENKEEAKEGERVETSIEEKKENEPEQHIEEQNNTENLPKKENLEEKIDENNLSTSLIKVSSQIKEKTEKNAEIVHADEEEKEDEVKINKQEQLVTRNLSGGVEYEMLGVEENLNVDLPSISQEKIQTTPIDVRIEEKKEDQSKSFQHEQMNTKSQITEIDSDLISHENFEQVVVPNFDENVQFSPIVKLKNPFKSEMKDDSGADSSDNTTTSPKSHGKDNFEKSLRDYHLPNFSHSLGYISFLEQNQKIKIEITSSRVNNSGFMGYATYISYIIKSKYLDSDVVLEAERRFSDFDWLNTYLRTNSIYKGLVFPILPPKKSLGNTDPMFIQQRKAELERYLREISRHAVLSKDNVLRTFLGEKGKEDFGALKERKPLKGIVIPELDWQKMREICEYAVANLKVKFKKENLPNDWSEISEGINEILKLDASVNKFMKNLQKKEDLYKTFHAMNATLNITYTKIMNKVTDESYFALGSLSSLLVAQAGNVHDESIINEDLTRDIKIFKSKLDGFKESYALLISTLEDIKTNKELNKNKQGKLFEYKAESNFTGINSVTLEMSDIDKKIEALEKDVITIKDNLSSETKNLFEEFEAFLPDILSEFYARQSEHFQKVSESWKQISIQ